MFLIPSFFKYLKNNIYKTLNPSEKTMMGSFEAEKTTMGSFEAEKTTMGSFEAEKTTLHPEIFLHLLPA